ncbi:MAG TPA: sulfatase-like hydrolase/transferase [Polyangiales bacterium]
MPTRPNIVFILADDLSWADLSVYGPDLDTAPELDRQAASGVRSGRVLRERNSALPRRR